MPFDDLGQVGRDDRRRIDYGIARALGAIADVLGDPHRRKTERGVGRPFAGDLFGDVARVDRKVVAHADRPTPDLGPADLETVLARLEPHIIDNPDARHDEPEVERHLSANPRHPVEQLGALVAVDERDETVAELERQRIERRDRRDLRRRLRCSLRLSRPRLRLLAHLFVASSRYARKPLITPSGMRTYQGKPGRSAMPNRKAATIQ